jgi:hypothetical protein
VGEGSHRGGDEGETLNKGRMRRRRRRRRKRRKRRRMMKSGQRVDR